MSIHFSRIKTILPTVSDSDTLNAIVVSAQREVRSGQCTLSYGRFTQDFLSDQRHRVQEIGEMIAAIRTLPARLFDTNLLRDVAILDRDNKCLKNRTAVAAITFFPPSSPAPSAVASSPSPAPRAPTDRAAIQTIGGSRSQFTTLKAGKKPGVGACSYCVQSAIKTLWGPILAGRPITLEMIDAATQAGVDSSPLDQNYGVVFELLRDDRDLVKPPRDPFFAEVRLQKRSAGFLEGIDRLIGIAQKSPDHMIAAGFTKNPMSHALFIKLGAPGQSDQFFFYDSHGDMSDPTTGANGREGAKAFVKIFSDKHQLNAYLTGKIFFSVEHGDEQEMVMYPDGSWVDNYNAYQMTPVLMPSRALPPPPPSAPPRPAPSSSSATTVAASGISSTHHADAIFADMRAELSKRGPLLAKLAKQEKPELHYYGKSPMETRLAIIDGMQRLERALPHLLDLCAKGRHSDVEVEIATRFNFTVHSEIPRQLGYVISSCPDMLRQAFQRAKAQGKESLDTFFVKGFCNPSTRKPDGAPYDIEACLEAKLDQWQRWVRL